MKKTNRILAEIDLSTAMIIFINIVFVFSFLVRQPTTVGFIGAAGIEAIFFYKKIRSHKWIFFAENLYHMLAADALAIAVIHWMPILYSGSLFEMDYGASIPYYALIGCGLLIFFFRKNLFLSWIATSLFGVILIFFSDDPGMDLSILEFYQVRVYPIRLFLTYNIIWFFSGMLVRKLDASISTESACESRKSEFFWLTLIMLLSFTVIYVKSYQGVVSMSIQYPDLIYVLSARQFAPVCFITITVSAALFAVSKVFDITGLVRPGSFRPAHAKCYDELLIFLLLFGLLAASHMRDWYFPFEVSIVIAALLCFIYVWDKEISGNAYDNWALTAGKAVICRGAVFDIAAAFFVLLMTWFLASRGMLIFAAYLPVSSWLLVRMFKRSAPGMTLCYIVLELWAASLALFWVYYRCRHVYMFATVLLITAFAVLAIMFLMWRRPDGRILNTMYIPVVIVLSFALMSVTGLSYGVDADFTITETNSKVAVELKAKGDNNTIDSARRVIRRYVWDDIYEAVTDKTVINDPVAEKQKELTIQGDTLEYTMVDKNGVVTRAVRYFPNTFRDLEYEGNFYLGLMI